ncbi:MAG: FG-GAP repeat protein [Opitutaceae bacterium]|jgi:hypothetical protein|nr:FG-GAP repeat protein [Opitutaceae bacterium]
MPAHPINPMKTTTLIKPGPKPGNSHAAALAAAFAFAVATINPLSPTARANTLTAFDGEEYDVFGGSASASGSGALAGAYGDDDKGRDSGSAYYFKDLDKVTGKTTYETVKLLASDGVATDRFGWSVSLSGANALIGAYNNDDKGDNSGAAYYYKRLDAVTPQSGPVTETVKLLASDGAEEDNFGLSVSLSGDNALVGAYGDADKGEYTGSAYYYKGLDKVTGKTTTETVKLLASDGAEEDHFSNSVSLSGDNALVGAFYDDDKGYDSGAAYYYKKLDSVSGNSTDLIDFNDKKATYETVKLLASDCVGGEEFGTSVSLDGDRFVIATGYTGKAYAGDIRAFTTLDAANGTALKTDGLSFVSQTDWIIGATTTNNTVTLTAGDTADITAPDKAVYIGQTAGADNNTLHIEGTLTATTVYVGAAGATGNTLRFTTDALDNLDVGTLYLDTGNFLEFEDAGHAIDHEDVAALLSGTTVQVRDSEGGWATLTGDNATTLLVKMQDVEDGVGGTWTRFTPLTASTVPEPATWAALAGLTLLAIAATQRHYRAARA